MIVNGQAAGVAGFQGQKQTGGHIRYLRWRPYSEAYGWDGDHTDVTNEEFMRKAPAPLLLRLARHSAPTEEPSMDASGSRICFSGEAVVPARPLLCACCAPLIEPGRLPAASDADLSTERDIMLYHDVPKDRWMRLFRRYSLQQRDHLVALSVLRAHSAPEDRDDIAAVPDSHCASCFEFMTLLPGRHGLDAVVRARHEWAHVTDVRRISLGKPQPHQRCTLLCVEGRNGRTLLMHFPRRAAAENNAAS